MKGNASGTVVVSQPSGWDQETGELILAEGDPLLAGGETVLFVTRYVPEHDWYGIVAAGYSDQRIGNADERRALVAKFGRAAAAGPKGPVPVGRLIEQPDPAAQAAAEANAPSRCAHEEAERTGTYRPSPECQRPRPDR